MSDSGTLLQLPREFGEQLTFSMEPIVLRRDQTVYAYELLYRGRRPRAFSDIDERLLVYLGSGSAELPTLFVNLSNDTMDTACDEALVVASRHADIYFELSERQMEPAVFERVAHRVNALSRRGVRFALDDFGSGHDALARLLGMDSVSVVKLDGALVRSAGLRAHAAKLLRALCGVLRSEGIRIVAECIEGPRDLELAEYLSVDMLQGHMFNSTVGTDLVQV